MKNQLYTPRKDLLLSKAWGDRTEPARNDRTIRSLFTEYHPAEDKPDRIVQELRHLGIFITPGADA